MITPELRMYMAITSNRLRLLAVGRNRRPSFSHPDLTSTRTQGSPSRETTKSQVEQGETARNTSNPNCSKSAQTASSATAPIVPFGRFSPPAGIPLRLRAEQLSEQYLLCLLLLNIGLLQYRQRGVKISSSMMLTISIRGSDWRDRVRCRKYLPCRFLIVT